MNIANIAELIVEALEAKRDGHDYYFQDAYETAEALIYELEDEATKARAITLLYALRRL